MSSIITSGSRRGDDISGLVTKKVKQRTYGTAGNLDRQQLLAARSSSSVSNNSDSRRIESITSWYGWGRGWKCFFIVGVIVCASMVARTRNSSVSTTWGTSPFPARSRGGADATTSSSSLEALWSILDRELFSADLLSSSGKNLVKPFPTGSFWTNLVLRAPSSSLGQRPSSSEAIVSEPYAYRWSPTGLQASYPAYRRSIQPNVIQHYFYPDITVTSFSSPSLRRSIETYHSTSVTLRFSDQADTKRYFETYVVQGSPYITTKFVSMAPKLIPLTAFSAVDCLSASAEEHGLCTKSTTSISGVQFTLQQAEGQRWLLFASEPITFNMIRMQQIQYLEATDTNYRGVLRLAYIPSDASLDGTLAQRLMAHSLIYPTSGRITTEYIAYSGKEMATITFAYDTEGGSGTNNANDILLMLILPHHVDAILSNFGGDSSHFLLSSTQFSGTYSCIKGNMSAVIGDSWSYRENLSQISLSTDTDITAHENIVNSIKRYLINDVTIVLPTETNIYGFGKEVARMAQLAHIAHEIGDMDSHKKAIRILHDSLVLHLFQRDDRLMYDTDFGGIISVAGLQDPNADFGNGRYNDHHFHYSYIIYASAILGRFNSTFLHRYGKYVDALVLDVASSVDHVSSHNIVAAYPLARHKSFYDGHSWASGLFPQANGKSQESSSEAVNCYFAVNLWSRLKEDLVLHNFSRLLLAMEIRSAKKYWHISPDSPFAYQPPFSTKNFMVGNLGGLDVTATTWFGNKPFYVHLINLLPITSITEELFDKNFVMSGQYASIQDSNPEMAWRGYLVCNHAIVDPKAAWHEATTQLVSYELDSSLSLSQVLYWISTRPYANLTDIEMDVANPTCEGNAACAQLDLKGNCCPTDTGVYLGCCY